MEEWKDIPGYEGLYQASNYGRIRSLDRVANGGRGSLTQRIKGKVLKPRARKGKYITYYTVSLCVNGKPTNYYVHRLVWSSFNGCIPNNMVINHIDENPANNRLDNLMICTQEDNLSWGTHNERVSKTLKELAKIHNPIINIKKMNKYAKDYQVN